MKYLFVIFALILFGCGSESNPTGYEVTQPTPKTYTLKYAWTCSSQEPAPGGIWQYIYANINYTVNDSVTVTTQDKRGDATITAIGGKKYTLKGTFDHDQVPDGRMWAMLQIFVNGVEVAVYNSGVTSQPISAEISYTVPK